MDKNTAKSASKTLQTEIMSLNPATLITMFELDFSDLIFQLNLDNVPTNVFRFHNTSILGTKTIFWQKNEYKAAPIRAEGYEVSSQGTPPTPRLAISVNDAGEEYFRRFKVLLNQIGDIAGTKVTRIRTFAKYLDQENYLDGLTPEGFEPNSNIEFPRDIYYIERKSAENKLNLEFELSSIFDVENIKLPARVVLQSKCNCIYRGNGCLYEYLSRRNDDIHGEINESSLPLTAISVANSKNELITDIIQTSIIDKGQYQKDTPYDIGNQVFIEKNGIKYYFVAKVQNPTDSPPNIKQWIADECSKTIKGCRLRWGKIGDGGLMFNGFPAVNKAV